MSHLNATLLSRWIVAGLVLLAPLAIGCSAKTETVREASPAVSPDAPPVPVVEPAIPPEVTPSVPDRGAAVSADPPSDADLVRETFGTETPENVADGGDDVTEAERPRSLFRSLGRALQKGVTDATGVTPAERDQAPQPEEDPR